MNREAHALVEGDVLLAVRLEIARQAVPVDAFEPGLEGADPDPVTLEGWIHPK